MPPRRSTRASKGRPRGDDTQEEGAPAETQPPAKPAARAHSRKRKAETPADLAVAHAAATGAVAEEKPARKVTRKPRDSVAEEQTLPLQTQPPADEEGDANRAGAQVAAAAIKTRTGGTSLRRLAADPLLQLASKRWSIAQDPTAALANAPNRDDALVRDLYYREMVGGGPDSVPTPPRRRRGVLEATTYLESFLYPTLATGDETNSVAHVLSIAILVCEKRRSGAVAWDWVRADADEGRFDSFFRAIVALAGNAEAMSALTLIERDSIVEFITVVFSSLELSFVRTRALKLVALASWHHLSDSRRELELTRHPEVARTWKKLIKREAREGLQPDRVEAVFFVRLLDSFDAELNSAAKDTAAATAPCSPGSHPAALCARFLELLVCLYSQLATRRFVRTLVDDRGTAARCALHPLVRSTHGATSKAVGLTSATLFARMFATFEALAAFEVDDHSGQPLAAEEVRRRHDADVAQMQTLLYARQQLYEPLGTTLAFETVSRVTEPGVLRTHISELSTERLKMLACRSLRVVSPATYGSAVPPTFCDERALLEESIVRHYARPQDAVHAINLMPLFPSDAELFDPANLLDGLDFERERGDSSSWDGAPADPDASVALPLPLHRLSLQYLTLKDYLTRCFHLHRLESTYEVKGDVQNAVRSLGSPTLRDGGASRRSHFPGWSKMALPLSGDPQLVEVGAPNLGETKPSLVLLEAKVAFDRREYSPQMVAEWDDLRPHDAVFLLTVGHAGTDCENAYGIRHVRGGEVLMIFDAAGNPTPNFRNVALAAQSPYFQRRIRARADAEEHGGLKAASEGLIEPATGAAQHERALGRERTIAIAMDAAQYHLDSDGTMAKGGANPYTSFNVVLRRRPEENNFKSVLDCIRDVLNEDQLRLSTTTSRTDGAEEDGEQAAPALRTLGGIGLPDWIEDVFLGYGAPDAAHPDVLAHESDGATRSIDFGDTFVDSEHVRESFPNATVEFQDAAGSPWTEPTPPFRCTFGTPPEGANEGDASVTVTPSTQPAPPPSSMRFSPAQVEAIRLGCMRGLSLVVGPPGTGKTDVAVQILSLLYRNFPHERVLIVTHSNAALNDVFYKLYTKNAIPQRYLLRLGGGERDLGVSENFSRSGRVDATLQRRLDLLGEVERLAIAMGVAESDAKDAAYTCESAARFHLHHVSRSFNRYVATVQRAKPGGSSPAFPFASFFPDEEAPRDLAAARACYARIQALFDELAEYRPFELLSTHQKRLNYLLVHQSKVVAMTTTHAALKRKDFLESGWAYDTLVMEESAQLTEMDTLIPMVLQRNGYLATAGCSLKRVVLIGDNNQLPPVVQNHVLRNFCNLEQPLFTRLVRLGVPHTTLDIQGRTRESICALYGWRYGATGLRTLAFCQAGAPDSPAPAGSPAAAYDLANAGFAHEYQFVDVNEAMGATESCPRPHYVQNLVEAEFVVATYMYMRMLGYPAESICLLTTYKGQRDLLEDVVARRCLYHPLFGRPRAISTVDQFQGQQSAYVLLSLVRTKSVGHARDVRRLVVALSRAQLGLYVFGNLDLYRDVVEWKPAMDLMDSRPAKLALLPSESVATHARRMADAIPRPFFVENMEALQQLVLRQAQAIVGGGGDRGDGCGANGHGAGESPAEGDPGATVRPM